MTLRDKLKRLFGTPPALSRSVEEERMADGKMEKEPPSNETTNEGAERELREFARGGARIDEVRAIELVHALFRSGGEARAIALGREMLARTPLAHRLAYVLSDLSASRGDDDLARALLALVLETREPPLEALVLGGELAERSDDPVLALSLYERALARDFDLPGAKERASRLREARAVRREPASATLLVDGALARGRWRVLRELGRGGAGTVFLARDVRLGRDVALKVYHARGPIDRERLRSEARVAASLAHPGVVRIVELDETLAAIAMEHLAVGSLRDVLRRAPLRAEEARGLCVTLVEALAFVHGRGIVHRDLKPSNVLLRESPDGRRRAVLSDFGLARRAGEDAPGTAGEGTLAFMAPEQRGVSVADPAMDVHAFGVTLREVLGRVSGDRLAPLLALAEACTARDPKARPPLAEVAVRLTTA